MEYKLKSITRAGIAEAAAKSELYRYLNEPEEAESICRDILAIDPANQAALRILGLAITDQFLGVGTDRYRQVEDTFQKLTDRYERFLLHGPAIRTPREGAASLGPAASHAAAAF